MARVNPFVVSLLNRQLSEALSFDKLRTNGERAAADLANLDVLEVNPQLRPYLFDPPSFVSLACDDE